MILEFKCVPHFFSFLFKPRYVPEATGGGLASSLSVYYSLKYIVLKILMSRGSQKSPPYIFFVNSCFFVFLKRACCGGEREGKNGKNPAWGMG